MLGKRLGHSFSVSYFSDKFCRENIDARYINFEIEEIGNLPSLLARQHQLQGFNVTIPYKEAIIPYLSQLTAEAELAAAVNTVRVLGDGRLIGHNTDIIGFSNSLTELLGQERPAKALVLGTGGASKAVQVALRRLGIEYAVVSRLEGRADVTYAALTDSLIQTHKLIINATPLGMWPDVASSPMLNYDAIDAGHFCFDLVYNPAVTAFMRACGNRGAKVCNGLGMLTAQAEAAWDWWSRGGEGV